MVNEKGVGVLTSVLIVVAVVVIGGLIIMNWGKLTGKISDGGACSTSDQCDSGVCSVDGVCLDAASAEAALAGKVTSTGTHATKTTITKATKITSVPQDTCPKQYYTGTDLTSLTHTNTYSDPGNTDCTKVGEIVCVGDGSQYRECETGLKLGDPQTCPKSTVYPDMGKTCNEDYNALLKDYGPSSKYVLGHKCIFRAGDLCSRGVRGCGIGNCIGPNKAVKCSFYWLVVWAIGYMEIQTPKNQNNACYEASEDYIDGDLNLKSCVSLQSPSECTRKPYDGFCRWDDTSGSEMCTSIGFP